MIDDNRHLDPALANDPSVESLAAEVADEFTERLARGERPEVEEYVRRHPKMASAAGLNSVIRFWWSIVTMPSDADSTISR